MCTEKNKRDKLMETRWNRLFLQQLISILRNSSTKNIVLFIEFFIFGPQSDYNKREDEQRSPIILIITFKQIIRPSKTVTSCSSRKGFVLRRTKENIKGEICWIRRMKLIHVGIIYL